MKKKLSFEEKRERVSRMQMINDVFLQKMAEDKGVCEEIIQTVLGDKTISVVESNPQMPLKNIFGRSVILDVLCKDSYGRYFNVEVQNADNDNHIRRVRYNGACVTTNIVDAGEKFELVPDVVVIYISAFDLFEKGKTVYRATMKLDDTFEDVNDGFVAYYINTVVDDKSTIAELMKCFKDSKYLTSSNFPKCFQRNKFLKENQEGVSSMCGVVEEIYKEGKLEGQLKGKLENLLDLVEDGILTEDDAIQRSGVTPEEYFSYKKEWEESKE